MSTNFVHFPVHLAAAGPQPRPGQSSICVCFLGLFLMTITGVLLFASPNTPQDIYILLLLGFGSSIMLIIGGIVHLRKSSSDGRRVFNIISENEDISLESISRATGISISRVRKHIEWVIFLKQVTGRIVDDRYVRKLIAERIDSDTVRCPHCKAELELSDHD